MAERKPINGSGDVSSLEHDPWLLTPGPITTTVTVKRAMLHDYGSRDEYFLAVSERLRKRLATLVGEADYTAVLMQGSGTFAVEAMIGTFVPRHGALMILANGAYGHRMTTICERLGTRSHIVSWNDLTAVDPEVVDKALSRHPEVTHVAFVHCETTSGILNPIETIASVVAAHGKALLIDAMSSFGAIAFDAKATRFDALAASANKCLQAIPGVGICLAQRAAIARAAGNSRSLSLDLYEQWQAMERTRQWRFTPPVHAVLALDCALDELDAEGGVAARYRRYQDNCNELIRGMRALGFEPLIPEQMQAPIIVTFRMPIHPRFDFQRFYEGMRSHNYIIYPGKLTQVDSFRMGCIGDLTPDRMGAAVAAVRQVMEELGVDLRAWRADRKAAVGLAGV